MQVDRHGNTNELQIAEINKLALALGKIYHTNNIIYTGDFNEDNYANTQCSPQVPTYAGTKATLDYVCSSRNIYSVRTINSHESDHFLVYGKTILR